MQKRIINTIAFLIGFSAFPLYHLGFYMAFAGYAFAIPLMFSGTVLLLAYVIYVLSHPFFRPDRTEETRLFRFSLVYTAIGIAVSVPFVIIVAR